MGRTRQYATAAARQAAYRQRLHATTVWVDRDLVTRMETALTLLHDATWRAVHQGHPLAHALYRATPVETVEAAVAWIVERLHTDTPDSAQAQYTDSITKCSDPNHLKK